MFVFLSQKHLENNDSSLQKNKVRYALLTCKVNFFVRIAEQADLL